MRSRRFIIAIALSAAANGFLTSPAQAFFGFGSDDTGKIGLDLNRGYDVNTVTTVSGKVISSPHKVDNEQVVAEIRSGNEIVSLTVGPSGYWDKNGIPLRANDDISAKGSRAQGKDGKTYVLTQKLSNRTTGKQIVLRNDKGEPAWTGADMSNSMRSGSSSGGSGMMRGGGGMMRSGGGGGMMRR